MFSNEKRCLYRRNPLAEVICQLRFPEILSINTNPPAEFQEAIRDAFPVYACRRETPPPTPNHPVPPQTLNHQFSTEDLSWRVNLTSRFFSLSCSRYSCWEEFAGRLDQPLAAFIRSYRPAYFERIGLRYVNFISRKALELEDIPFSRLFQPAYLGLLTDEEVLEATTTRCNLDVETAIRGGCRVKLHAGPGMVKRGNQSDPEVKYILDLDLFMPGKIPVNLSAGAMSTLHSQAYPIFRGAITDTLHEAMYPHPES